MALRIPSLLLFLALSAVVVAAAGQARSSEPLPPAKAFQIDAQRDQDTIRLTFTPASGYYLYRDKFAAEAGGRELELDTPAGTVEQDPNFGSSEVYREPVIVTLTASEAETVRLTYQGCQEDGICYPPLKRTLDVVDMSLGPVDAAFGAMGAGKAAPFGWQSGAIGGAAESAASAESAGVEPASASPDTIERIAAGGGAIIVVASFLGFGLLLAFTPCVLPMYPILGGMLAREGERLNAGRGFTMSLVYVTAMAAAFGLLGVVAAWSGQNLQILLQSPPAIAAIAAVFVALALSMFGLYDLQLSAAVTNRLAGAGSGRGSLASAATLGFTSALIVGPCVTPPLAAGLLYVGQTGDVGLGAATLFALGFGQGVPLIVFATFGSGLLPRAGGWMEGVKIAFGFVFLASAVYMLARIVPPGVSMALWAVLALAIGVFVGGLDSLSRGSSMARRFAKAAGLIALVYGGMLAVGAASGADDPLRPLGRIAAGGGGEADEAAGVTFAAIEDGAGFDADLSGARTADRPALVYFTADWCVSCKVMERNALASPAVAEALDGFERAKVDLSRLTDAKKALMGRLGVVGPPTMVFYGADGNERPGARLVGEVSADELAGAARRVVSR